MTRTITNLASALAALSLSASVAQAQDVEALLQQGVEARRVGDDERALELFEQANELRPSAVATAQMALAAQALGRWVVAYENMVDALSSSDPFVAENRVTLEQALTTIEGHVGRIELRSRVAGGRVEINGREVGALPLPAPVVVRAGQAIITVRVDGYHPLRVTTEVSPGMVAREELRLVPLDAPVATPIQPTPTPTATPGSVAVDPRRVEEGGDDASTAAGFAFVGVAGASVITLAVFTVAYVDTSSFLDGEECEGEDRAVICPVAAESVSNNTIGMIVSGIGAAAAGVTAIVLLATASSDSDDVAFRCGGGPGDIGIGCGGRF